ncbi:MAG: Cys-tRNA(Pro)/Cys-tRNA(Cys) deacylase [Phycisphaerales bacterium]|jgi:hypothetical protein|nr:Cys-tRNA(Pro)/Cys-tRNA(Cys) deacylase [Phycisphaerales bacterium]
MTKRILWALAGLNVLLVMTLAARLTSDNAAHAQAAKRPSDYIMIPGEVGGGSSAVVYMIDTGNGLLGAMTYDDSRKELNTMAPIDLSRVFEAGAPATPRGPAVAPGARPPGR